MKLLSKAWKSLHVNVEEALKQNFLTTAFNGSKDLKVSEKFYSLVFENMNYFQQELQNSKLPKSLDDLLETITKGVKVYVINKGVCRTASADEV